MNNYYYFISSLDTRIASGGSCKNQLFSVLSVSKLQLMFFEDGPTRASDAATL